MVLAVAIAAFWSTGQLDMPSVMPLTKGGNEGWVASGSNRMDKLMDCLVWRFVSHKKKEAKSQTNEILPYAHEYSRRKRALCLFRLLIYFWAVAGLCYYRATVR